MSQGTIIVGGRRGFRASDPATAGGLFHEVEAMIVRAQRDGAQGGPLQRLAHMRALLRVVADLIKLGHPPRNVLIALAAQALLLVAELDSAGTTRTITQDAR